MMRIQSSRSSVPAILAVLAVFALSPADASAQAASDAKPPLELPALLSDHLVLQRESEVTLWGRTAPGTAVRITTSWNGTSVEAEADTSGRFRARVRTGAAGGPHTIDFEGGGRVTVRDVLLGEVWLASGQSNMEWPIAPVRGMSGIGDWQAVVAEAELPTLRLFDVPNTKADAPRAECAGSWRVCTRENAPEFSATAYFFGREIARELGVPVGLVTADWGGTPVEAWTSAAGLATLANPIPASLAAKLELRRGSPDQLEFSPNHPSVLFNGMIAPLASLAPRGVIWYQGESNRKDASEYRDWFGALIADWRRHFAAQKLPFYFVQIAPYRYGDLAGRSAFVRDAQRRALEVPHTGMAVTLDIGDLEDIHPKEKREVGRRLALQALAKTYGRTSVEADGPLYRAMKVEGASARIEFTHARGLRFGAHGPVGFTIAGADLVYRQAEARIEGESLVLSSPEVPSPAAVRYAFEDTSTASLFNAAGLPASTFQSDDAGR